jgi:phosphatidylserine decarboxylase
MVAEPSTYPGFGVEAPMTSIQPGGGWGMRVELAWGRVRRAVLRTLFPGYVKRQRERRVGACPGCPGSGGGVL